MSIGSGRAAALVCSVMLALPAGSAFGQAARFDIAPQPLSRALMKFSSKTGIQLFFNANVARGLASQGARGELTPQAALAALLSGTGLSYEFTNANTVTIRGPITSGAAGGFGDGVIAVDQIDVSGERATGPVEGYVATRSTTGSKTDADIMSTPRSVSVVTKDAVEARGGVTNVRDAFAYTAGYFSYDDVNTRTSFSSFSRGFSLGYSNYLDGLAMPHGVDRASPQIEPYGLERMELLKGPASILYGQGTPGGILNSVSKRPTFDPGARCTRLSAPTSSIRVLLTSTAFSMKRRTGAGESSASRRQARVRSIMWKTTVSSLRHP